MQTTVRVYFNTGFNTINIPDSPALLETLAFSHADAAALDINQDCFLSSVRIRSDWNTVKNGDYCKIGNFYYFIDNIFMSSGDVAELSLTPDYVNSAGGVAALDILDGITDRVHVVDDSYGLYGEDDPYMAPAYDMDVKVDITSGDFTGTACAVFIESTLDLFQLGEYDGSSSIQPAMTAVDPNDSTYYVSYPTVPYRTATNDTSYSTVLGGSIVNLPSTQGMTLWNLDENASYYNALCEGIARARALGIEEALSGQFSIPRGFITPTVRNGGSVQSLAGNGGTRPTSGVPFVYGSANNNRVFYGSQSPYTLIAASGSSVSAKAEEIYGGGTGPSVRYAVDPRREGKPYFRFDPMNGINASNNKLDIFRNGVGGKQWRNVPMVFTDKSGGLLDQINYEASQKQHYQDLQHNQENYEAANAVSKLNTFISGFTSGVGGIPGAINAGEQQYMRDIAYNQYRERAGLQRAIEEQQFMISQNVNVPTVKFPIDADLFADASNNGYIVTRAVYKSQDISRIDKILTAFGYKVTKVLEESDFTNRTYFNYVRASISVGSLPRWWANGVAAQISGGVRVWHVKPNHAYYTNNPVRV